MFVTGIFDLLHIEHVRFLEAAKNLGGKLIVGIESDNRVKRLKGDGRPIMAQDERKQMLQALRCVDQVFVLPEKFDTSEDYLRVMRQVKPDFYAVSDQSPYLDTKYIICRQAGVKLRVVRPYNPEYSTTKLIEKICTP